MATLYGANVVRDGLVFAWDGMNAKSWDGSSSTHYDLVGRGSGTKNGANSLTRTNGHVLFNGGGTRVCTVDFPDANITVPTGNQGSWMFAHEFSDAGSIDPPAFGKETGSGWNGTNGFVFGTGWGTDGPRWGIGSQAFTVYSSVGSTTGDYRQAWQIYTVTYQRNTTNGLKTYLCDSNGNRLVDERDTGDFAIGSNTGALKIGSTVNRGGNWNGNMDFVLMWDRVLTQEEVNQNINATRGRFGI